MLEQLQEYVEQYRLFNPGEPVLLAVSGGVDSMVLAELFHRAGYYFAIAHCNFGLRGSESNQDEAFVASMAESYRVRFFVKHFKTREYAGFNKISVQMAARTLRYEWFEELLSTEGFNAVATAHHLDDQIETFFINVLRGTGISVTPCPSSWSRSRFSAFSHSSKVVFSSTLAARSSMITNKSGFRYRMYRFALARLPMYAAVESPPVSAMVLPPRKSVIWPLAFISKSG
jgi:tRNA(Ile)-lysidine synthetase-like protein